MVMTALPSLSRPCRKDQTRWWDVVVRCISTVSTRSHGTCRQEKGDEAGRT